MRHFALSKVCKLLQKALRETRLGKGLLLKYLFFEWGGYFASNMRAYLRGVGMFYMDFVRSGLGWLAVIICFFLFTGLDDGLC